jgi:nucleotide-binding universal stress UspA family protein
MTTQQVAQLLLGIARAQHALIEALESSKAGFKATHVRPVIETAARIRTNRPETLSEYPSRLLLQMLGRTAPDAEAVLRDLKKLLDAPPVAPDTSAGVPG